MVEGKKSYQCPACSRPGTLWEAVMVPGWRSINQHLDPEGDRDVDWLDAETWGRDCEIGCVACGWEGSVAELVAIGIDGKPLPVVHPEQAVIES